MSQMNLMLLPNLASCTEKQQHDMGWIDRVEVVLKNSCTPPNHPIAELDLCMESLTDLVVVSSLLIYNELDNDLK
jgi:hypothetical protein